MNIWKFDSTTFCVSDFLYMVATCFVIFKVIFKYMNNIKRDNFSLSKWNLGDVCLNVYHFNVFIENEKCTIFLSKANWNRIFVRKINPNWRNNNILLLNCIFITWISINIIYYQFKVVRLKTTLKDIWLQKTAG
jgi:hypothetical protein